MVADRSPCVHDRCVAGLHPDTCTGLVTGLVGSEAVFSLDGVGSAIGLRLLASAPGAMHWLSLRDAGVLAAHAADQQVDSDAASIAAQRKRKFWFTRALGVASAATKALAGAGFQPKRMSW